MWTRQPRDPGGTDRRQRAQHRGPGCRGSPGGLCRRTTAHPGGQRAWRSAMRSCFRPARPLLRDVWLAETHADRVVRSRLDDVAAEWNRNSRDPIYLYAGSLLAAATETATRISTYPAPLPAPEQDRTRLPARQQPCSAPARASAAELRRTPPRPRYRIRPARGRGPPRQPRGSNINVTSRHRVS